MREQRDKTITLKFLSLLFRLYLSLFFYPYLKSIHSVTVNTKTNTITTVATVIDVICLIFLVLQIWRKHRQYRIKGAWLKKGLQTFCLTPCPIGLGAFQCHYHARKRECDEKY